MQALAILLTLAVAAPSGYEWHQFKDGTDDYALRMHGQQIGHYDAARGVYRPLDPQTQRFGPACKPPVPPPRENFGVNTAEISKETRYTVNGQAVSRADADTALSHGNPLIGDASDLRHRVVIIGPDDLTQPLVAAFTTDPATAGVGKDYLVTAWRPDDWHVARSGYVCDGKPTVYLVRVDGEVLYRRDDADCGAAALAQELRDADPDYNPDNDPGPGKPFAALNDPMVATGAGSVLAVIVAGVLALWSRKKWQRSASLPRS